jgi:cellulose synthase/poly-beta-1,6-N-acetylglucosamine synthase-like glycosyltransferase
MLFSSPKVNKDSITPKVTMIISCYNEENVLAEKLQNSLGLDYPHDLLEVLVVSDGSTDKTDEIAKAYQEQGVRLIRQEGRLGKTMGLNLAVPEATGDIIVFSDANAMYQADAVRRLIENFADTSVGYVVGEAQYAEPGQTAASSNENSYWNYEIFIKKMESNLHSVVGGDGAIYAIRKELYEELKRTDINDFVNPLQIIVKGYRGIYEPSAIALESAAGSFSKEFGRKGRIVNRAFTGLLRVKEVMNPFTTGFFAFQIISHKLLRWLIPFFLLSFGVSSLSLAILGNSFGHILVALTVLASVLSLMGWWGQDREKNFPAVLFLPYYFSVVNLAAFIGILQSLRGDVQVTWNTVRSDTRAKGIHNRTVPVILVLSILCLTTVVGLIGVYAGCLHAVNFLFWFSICAVSYVYLGYPVVLYFWSKVKPKLHDADDAYLPTVTVLVCAYNEEKVIKEKIENSLDLDYPVGKLKIVIASDGSTDKTPEIISKYLDDRLVFYNYDTRFGKIGVILNTIPKIASEIIVFSDANTMYLRSAIRMLIRNFADPVVGAVSGDVTLQNEETSFGESESAYYVYERWIQQAESKIGSMVGADGAMYAIRRDLFIEPSKKTILDDFVISMNVALQGYRVVYDSEAKAYEGNTISHKSEFLRKSRIIAGAVQTLLLCEGGPSFRQPQLLFCYLSHKLLRWIVPCLLVVCLTANIILYYSSANIIFSVFLIFQGAFYILAVLGYWNRRNTLGRLFSIPFYFCLVNGAALYGLYKGVFNKQKVTWEVFSRERN